jgi:hypothetical protein
LRLERDQNDVVLAEVEPLLKCSFSPDLHGADFQRCTAVLAFDFGNLGPGQLRGRS